MLTTRGGSSDLTPALGEAAFVREVMERAPAVICVTRGPDHVVEVANARFRELFAGRELVGRRLADSLPEVEQQGFLALLDNVFRTGEPYVGRQVPFHFDREGGTEPRYYDFVYQPVGQPGSVRGIFVHAVDITEQVEARRVEEERSEALQRSEEHLRIAMDAARQGSWEWVIGEERVVWSTALEGIHGLEPGTFGGTFEDYQRDIHPEDREYVLGTIAKTLEQREPHHLQYRIIRPDGQVRWLEARGRLFTDAQGSPQRLVGVCTDITDRRRQELELAAVHERQAAILDAALDCIVTMDERGRIEEFNPAAERVFGYTRDEVRGQEMAALIIPPRFRAAHRRGLERFLATGESRIIGQRLELTAMRKGGAEFPVELTISRVGEPGRSLFIGSMRDITERKAAEQALLDRTRLSSLAADVGLALTQSGTRAETLQRCCQAVVDRLDAAFARIWTLNEAAQVLELEASAGLYTHLDGAHGRVPVGKFKIGLIAQERKPHLTNQVIGDPRVGDQQWAEREGMVAFAGYPLLIGDELVGVLAMFSRRELSDADFQGLATVANGLAIGIARQRTLDAVRASEAQYRFLADSLPSQVWTATPAGLLDYCNERTVKYFDQPMDAIIGQGWQAVVHKDDLPETLRRWTKALSTGERYETEFRLRNARGEWRWHIGRAVAQRDAEGRIVRWYGTNIDVQDFKEAQLALAERAEELGRLTDELRYQQDLTTTIMDNAASALFMMDQNGYPLYLNSAACQMTGYTGIAEIKDRPLHYAVHFKKPDGSFYPMEECPIDQANADIVALKDQREIFCRKDGTLFPVQYNVAPVSKEGVQLGAVIEVRDITEQERTENELRQRADELARLAEALERSNRELDQFAYIASHDLKAPLRGIANLSQWIEEDLPEAARDAVQENMALLRGRVHRMEALIEGVLQYSRVGRGQTPATRVDTRQLAAEVVDFLSPPDHVQVSIDEGLPVLVTERLPLQQVLLNLVGNAVKHAHAVEPRIRVDAREVDGAWEFAVADNGPGIAPAFHERIWGIFQTLEARDKVEGTGIGLALVKKIVEKKGGRVWVESAEGQGATFRFRWPAETAPREDR